MMSIVAQFRAAKELLDGLFTLASLICVPALSGMGLIWAVAPATELKVSGPAYVVSASAGEETAVPIPWSANNATPLTYKIYLMKDEDIVEDYPEVVTNSNHSPEFGNLMFRIPQRVPTGTYQLVADITYIQNPLKTGIIRIELAQVQVTR